MINPAHYDGQIHDVHFEVGEDFIRKWDAYRGDGFMVQLTDKGFFRACRLMCGEDIPE